MDQCRDRQFRFSFEIGLENNNPLIIVFGFIFDRQTAESFTSSTTSASTTTIFLRLNRNLNLQTCNVVRKMLANESNDLLGRFPLSVD